MEEYFNDPNECWRVWKSLFHEILDKHAPLRQKRIKANSVPWITPDVKRPMRNRDYHTKKAIKCASQYHWETYQAIRNRVNIEMQNLNFIVIELRIVQGLSI